MRFHCVVFLLLLGSSLTAQQFVKIHTVEKGNVVEVPLSLVFRAGELEFEPLRFQNGFVVPPEISKFQFVDVRVRFKKYDFTLSEVSTNKFEGEWTVGIDSPPFTPEFKAQQRFKGKKRLRLIYYLKCDPIKGDGTQLVESVYK